jgi:predicted outer membrane lipoprotein
VQSHTPQPSLLQTNPRCLAPHFQLHKAWASCNFSVNFWVSINGSLFCSNSILNIKKTNKIHKFMHFILLRLQCSEIQERKKAKERPKAGDQQGRLVGLKLSCSFCIVITLWVRHIILVHTGQHLIIKVTTFLTILNLFRCNNLKQITNTSHYVRFCMFRKVTCK